VRALASIVLGGVLLVWPAVLNLYPLVFIDTASYLLHGATGAAPWDKTQAYGPAIALFHRHWALWPAMVAQGLAASHLAWLLVRSLRGGASPVLHLGLCAGLAALTSAPWFLATLMPDALTGLAPLCLFLLAFGALSRVEAVWVALLGALAIAAHLSHLPTAVALVVLTALLARRAGPVLRAAAPLALAILFLLGSNVAGFGRATLSPHGAVFLLARLQADGPAAETLRARCPEARWHLCAFTDRLPMDSDEFLWDGTSPLNREADGSPRAMGGMRGAAEAREIIAATLRDHPGAVVRAMLANTLRQLALVRVGDTLSDEYLALSARRGIAEHFPPEELAAFDAGAQMRGELPARAAPFLWLHVPVLLGALAAALAMLWSAARRRDLRRGAVLLFALVALAGNAAATGALSKPHHRYQARVVWLLPLVVMLVLPPPRPSPASGGGRRLAQ
jgi:hypothetical protein